MYGGVHVFFFVQVLIAFNGNRKHSPDQLSNNLKYGVIRV